MRTETPTVTETMTRTPAGYPSGAPNAVAGQGDIPDHHLMQRLLRTALAVLVLLACQEPSSWDGGPD